MEDWNGSELKVAHSKGGVLVVANPLQNLVSTGIAPWPAPEIIQKLYQSRHVRAFEGQQLKIATSGLGYYCDLQSIHSEDAITWSVFGTIARSDPAAKEKWLSDLFLVLGLPECSAHGAEIFLWRRVPHPDTLVPGGPEIDFGIITADSVVLGEAKWQSAVGRFQGKQRDKDQIQLRGEFLAKYGRRFFPKVRNHVVLAVSLLPHAFRDTVPGGVLFRSCTWDEVCSLTSHHLCDEVQRYFQWKRSHSGNRGSDS